MSQPDPVTDRGRIRKHFIDQVKVRIRAKAPHPEQVIQRSQKVIDEAADEFMAFVDKTAKSSAERILNLLKR